MTSGWIRDTGPETQTLGGASSERQSDVRITGEVLRVDDQHAVPPGSLGAGRNACSDLCGGHTHRPHFNRLLCPHSARLRGPDNTASRGCCERQSCTASSMVEMIWQT